MLPLQQFTGTVLAEILRRQPASKEKTAFAWRLAVGPALARVSTVETHDRTLIVRTLDPRWTRELERASGTILLRLQHLLGREAIERIHIEEHRSSHA